jgi:hypothetical protein
VVLYLRWGLVAGMELLLNLLWVLLVLPAYWLWRRDAELRLARRVTPLQGLLALGCGLVLLFPVISATDDLHAMRAEMEESATSKRTVRQASSEKSAGVNRLQGPPAVLTSAVWLVAAEVRPLEVSVVCLAPLARASVFYAGRAPPFSLLG